MPNAGSIASSPTIGMSRSTSGSRTRRADEVRVALVVGVHRHRRVAQHRLGPGGGHGQVTSAGQRVLQVPEVAVTLLLLGLLVGERRQAARAPVDDVVAAVDQPLLVEPDEHLAHRPRESLVQGEVGAAPVAARSRWP